MSAIPSLTSYRNSLKKKSQIDPRFPIFRKHSKSILHLSSEKIGNFTKFPVSSFSLNRSMQFNLDIAKTWVKYP